MTKIFLTALRSLSMACLAGAVVSCGLVPTSQNSGTTVPRGTIASAGTVKVRAWKTLFQQSNERGYLMLKDPSVSEYTSHLYAAGLGSESDILAAWASDQAKTGLAEKKTAKIHGKSVTVYHALYRNGLFGDGGSREIVYAWLPINGRGCKVELNQYISQLAPGPLGESYYKSGYAISDFCRFAEAVSVGK